MVTYLHESYKNFVKNYNILNGQLTDQYRLNRSVNVLKKESDDSYNRLEIIRGSYAIPWDDFTEYKEGQIVSFTSDSGLPTEVTKNYSVKPGMTNTNKIPDVSPMYWKEVTINDFIAPLTTSNIVVKQAENANKLGDLTVDNFVKATNTTGLPYKGLSVDNADNFIRTTTSGFLPKDQNKTSTIGLDGWEFKEIHSSMIYGAVTTNNFTGISEKYTSDNVYGIGTVLAIGGSKETTLYKTGMKVAGVVVETSAFKMNGAIDGVYIALKGRVRVKISGTAKKGDYIVAYDNGWGITSSTKTDNFIGIALEDNSDLIEVMV